MKKELQDGLNRLIRKVDVALNASKNEDERRDVFIKDLEQLINKYSMENGSNTPDFLLADYLIGCLDNFNRTMMNRDSYYETKKDQG